MKHLLGLLLVMGIAGCGGGSEGDAPPAGETASPATPKSSQVEVDEPPAQAADDAVAALKKLRAKIERNEQGEVIGVSIASRKFTDADLVHLKELTSLETLNLRSTKITDAGLVHLKPLSNLETLYLTGTKINDAGLAHLKGLPGLRRLVVNNTQVTYAGVTELQKALPNCKIRKQPPSPLLPPVRVRLLATRRLREAGPPTNTHPPTLRNASSKSGQSTAPGNQGL